MYYVHGKGTSTVYDVSSTSTTIAIRNDDQMRKGDPLETTTGLFGSRTFYSTDLCPTGIAAAAANGEDNRFLVPSNNAGARHVKSNVLSAAVTSGKD